MHNRRNISLQTSKPTMPTGSLEVILIRAKDLQNEIFTNIDTYVILTYKTQEQKSTVGKGAGSDPEWNEVFQFSVEGEATKLLLRLMDKDTLSSDDFLGRCDIELHTVFEGGSISNATYPVYKDGERCGEVKLTINFNEEYEDCRSH